jgi:prepilin-type N-terminal cleavage/methylation domain-containing protein
MLKKGTVKNKNRQSGFTLVELSIVFVIVGLLIGGVIKGTELIENARVTSISAQIKTYQSAVTSFRDTYGALPGDMRDATQRINGCNAANNCTNGGGNQIIGGPDRYNQVILNMPEDNETVLFWKHLLLADLISGVAPDAFSNFSSCAANVCNIQLGVTHPKTPFGGGFYVVSAAGNRNPNTTAPYLTPGVYFLAANMSTRTANIVSFITKHVFSPKQAQGIDTKMDDGVPQGMGGRVIATPINHAGVPCADVPGGIPGSSGAPPSSPPPPGSYLVSNAKTCALYFYSGL